MRIPHKRYKVLLAADVFCCGRNWDNTNICCEIHAIFCVNEGIYRYE